MRAVFFGTPAIALPALRALTQIAEVVALVCQPDRPSGRGLRLTPPPTKRTAEELGIAVHQPTKVRTGELAAWLRAQQADVSVVLAYGRILPSDVLSATRRGALNLHASLLPKYRGAAPINWCIAEGETETGVSLMQMDEGLDTGAVYAQRKLAISPSETGGSLTERMAELAALVVTNDLAGAVAGEYAAQRQEDSRATHAPLIERKHLEIDWHSSAIRIERLVRAMAPRPGAFTLSSGKVLRLHEVTVAPETILGAPGRVSIFGRRALVSTGSGTLEIGSAQLEGKRALPALDLINGRVLGDGAELGAAAS